MDVAILYSGGKDSTLAIEHAKNKGWNIKYLISIKPSRRDCYLFHFATVEHTKELANILGYKHILEECKVADPEKEAEIVKNIVLKNEKINALILGGIGLQETQIRTLQKTFLPLEIEVFPSHAEFSEEESLNLMLNRGYKIIISQIASQGLKNWLGEELTLDNLNKLKQDSLKHGFNLLGEGGYYDSLVIDGPIFSKRLEIIDSEKIFDDEYCGYLKINNLKIANKITV